MVRLKKVKTLKKLNRDLKFCTKRRTRFGEGEEDLEKIKKAKEEEEKAKKEADSVSADNPFSFSEFMAQPFPEGTPLIKVATAQANAKQVYNALSGYFFDSPDMIIGLFNSYKNKAQVAQMAQAFYIAYKRDILTFLKNGNKVFDFGTGGLSETDYNRIVTIVNKKSKF